MRFASGHYQSVCCNAAYEEHIEQLPGAGGHMVVYKCGKCKKPCRIMAPSKRYVSGCCKEELLHPTEMIVDNGREIQRPILPRICGHCKDEQNFCVCELGMYYVCSKCNHRTNIIEEQEKQEYVRIRKVKK